MASRIEAPTATIPAGTTSTAPYIASLQFDIGEVDEIDVVVPPGCHGLVGFGILFSGVSIFPREDSRWIVTDDEVIKWPIENAPTAGAWAVRAYNLDVYPHTLHFRFLVREVVPAAAQLPTITQI